MKRITLTTQPSEGYELLDSGREEKLERYGDVVLARPDPQALWEKRLGEGEWLKAQGRFERNPSTSSGQGGIWHAKDLPKEWNIEFGGFTFLIKPTSFKHTGLFPEQLSNWKWITNVLGEREPKQKLLEKNSGHAGASLGAGGEKFSRENVSAEGLSVLNLFGYTGGATLAAAKAGANVTHVDASKTAVAWARQNAELSGLRLAEAGSGHAEAGLKDAPIRWIVEDAVTFVKREIKRGVKYDAIIMDPPAFGRGPAGELWKIEEDFLELMKLLPELLSEKPLFVLINGYAAGYSPLAFAYNLESFGKKWGGEVEYGDLEIAEKSGRVLPCGIFARWVK